MGELYGEVNKLTLEWNDGLMAMTVRKCVQVWITMAPNIFQFHVSLIIAKLRMTT